MWIERLDAICRTFPKTYQEDAWVGVRWRVGQATVSHVFGGDDQQFRLMFRGEQDEVVAFENMGHPYFRAGWGGNVIGMIIDDTTDWQEVRELLTDSYCLQAPKKYAREVLERAGLATNDRSDPTVVGQTTDTGDDDD